LLGFLCGSTALFGALNRFEEAIMPGTPRGVTQSFKGIAILLKHELAIRQLRQFEGFSQRWRPAEWNSALQQIRNLRYKPRTITENFNKPILLPA
jgi:hypothetical protein